MAGSRERLNDVGRDQLVQELGRLWRCYAYGLAKLSWFSRRALMGGCK